MIKTIQLTDEFTVDENMPKLEIDDTQSLVIIIGRCLPESANKMQQQLNEQLEPLLENARLHFMFKLEFFNTSSSKVIELFLNKMEEHHKRGEFMQVTWFFTEDDEDMEEAGEEFATLVTFPFELAEY